DPAALAARRLLGPAGRSLGPDRIRRRAVGALGPVLAAQAAQRAVAIWREHTMSDAIRRGNWALVVWLVLPGPMAAAQTGGKDWPMYNGDVIGTGHNPEEPALGRETGGRLEEKWRFPPRGSDLEVGVIHATPIVVDGYVYFGTATDPTF